MHSSASNTLLHWGTLPKARELRVAFGPLRTLGHSLGSGYLSLNTTGNPPSQSIGPAPTPYYTTSFAFTPPLPTYSFDGASDSLLGPFHPPKSTLSMLKSSRQPIHQYELVPRDSIDEEQHDAGRDPLDTTTASRSSWLDRLPWPLANVNKLSERAVYVHYVTPRRRKRSLLRLIYWTIFSVPYLLILLVLVTGAFFPSYTIRPPHYDELRKRAITTGRANPYNETVFIVASLAEHKGDLTSGAWGKEVLQLIDLLGPENVHLSIYEDNPDPVTKQSLKAFRDEVKCKCIHRRCDGPH